MLKVEGILYSEAIFNYEQPQIYKLNQAIVPEELQDPMREVITIANILLPKREFITGSTNFISAAERLGESNISLSKYLEEALLTTNFLDPSSTLTTIIGIKDKLDSYHRELNRAFNQATSSIQHKKNKAVVVMSGDKTYLEKDRKSCELFIALFTCLESSIKSLLNKDSEIDLKGLKQAGKLLYKIFNEELSSQQSPFTDALKPLLSTLEEIFSELALLEEIKGIHFPHTERTMFELKAKFLPNYLNMIKAWQSEASKDSMLKAYKNIFFLNKSLTEMTVIICQEMVNLGLYKDALKLIDEIEECSESAAQENIDKFKGDINILKLFCYEKLGDFYKAYSILKEIPEEILGFAELKIIQLKVYMDMGYPQKVSKICETIADDIAEFCYKGNIEALEEILRFLSENNLEISLESEEGDFLGGIYAANDGNKEILELLFKYQKPKLSKHLDAMLARSVMSDHHECIYFLVKQGARLEDLKGSVYSYYKKHIISEEAPNIMKTLISKQTSDHPFETPESYGSTNYGSSIGNTPEQGFKDLLLSPRKEKASEEYAGVIAVEKEFVGALGSSENMYDSEHGD